MNWHKFIKVWLFLVVLVIMTNPVTTAQLPKATLYLPLIQGYRPPAQPTIFGGEIVPVRFPSEVADLAGEGGMTWTRYTRLSWAAVEPTQGARHWAGLAEMERHLAAFSGARLTNLVIIGDAPAWARQDPNKSCSPLKPEALPRFATFMAEVTARYRRPPYYVNHFEIYNEPDVTPAAIPAGGTFGCWGDESDTNYGGGYFSEMLTAIYAPMKAVNPDVQVIIGGLLLHCDYTYVYSNGANCATSRFLKGILEEGQGENFDMVAYHGYALQSTRREDWDLTYYFWSHRGGVTMGKLDFLRDELANAEVDKPILLTEAGLLCYEGSACDSNQTLLYQDQANYVVRLYSRGLANDLEAIIWYAFNDPNWRRTGLVDRDNQTRPAYTAYRFMNSRLGQATYVGQLGTGVGQVEGYQFRTSSLTYSIYWSNSTQVYAVPFTPGALLYDKFGNPVVPPTGGTLSVGFEPIYVVTPLAGTTAFE